MDIFTIATHLLALAAGALIGVGLGRRSTGANKAYDAARREADELRARLDALREKNKS